MFRLSEFQCRSTRLPFSGRAPLHLGRLTPDTMSFAMTLQLLREQTQFLRQQERLRYHRLAEERREGLADAAEIKRSNREAFLQEKANQQRIRAETLRAQRYVERVLVSVRAMCGRESAAPVDCVCSVYKRTCFRRRSKSFTHLGWSVPLVRGQVHNK